MVNTIKKDIIHAKGFDIGIYTTNYENEFISLTDIARYKSDMPHDVVKNWMRNRETIEFLGIWESLHNPDFKQVEYDLFRSEAGLHASAFRGWKKVSIRYPGHKKETSNSLSS